MSTASWKLSIGWRQPPGRVGPQYGTWRSLVAHLLWEQGVGGSNPLVPTTLTFDAVAERICYIDAVEPVERLVAHCETGSHDSGRQPAHIAANRRALYGRGHSKRCCATSHR